MQDLNPTVKLSKNEIRTREVFFEDNTAILKNKNSSEGAKTLTAKFQIRMTLLQNCHTFFWGLNIAFCSV